MRSLTVRGGRRWRRTHRLPLQYVCALDRSPHRRLIFYRLGISRQEIELVYRVVWEEDIGEVVIFHVLAILIQLKCNQIEVCIKLLEYWLLLSTQNTHKLNRLIESCLSDFEFLDIVKGSISPQRNSQNKQQEDRHIEKLGSLGYYCLFRSNSIICPPISKYFL